MNDDLIKSLIVLGITVIMAIFCFIAMHYAEKATKSNTRTKIYFAIIVVNLVLLIIIKIIKQFYIFTLQETPRG